VIANSETVLRDYVEWEGQGFRHFLEFLGILKVRQPPTRADKARGHVLSA
jgi:hypothetical protein